MNEDDMKNETPANEFVESLLGPLDPNSIFEIKDLLSIFEYSYDGIALSNKQGLVLYVNKAVERISGFDRKYLIRKTPQEYKREGLVLTAVKTIKDNVINVIQLSRTGKVHLITTVPVFFKNKMFYLSNFREMNDLSNLHHELLDKLMKKENYYSEQFKEVEDMCLKNEIVVKSPQMNKIMGLITKICKTDVTVNITGESGVGKDVIAKLIHNLSERKDKPFVEINCSSIPENLLESELFGYVEGSFTGAVKMGKAGLLESANEGTVFLDELGDMPFNLQIKLLKVLQDKEIMRIGGRKPIKLDLRIICATNQNLEQRIKEGKFREDLYFRINIMPFYIPPLRERKEDILHLSNFFLQKYSKKYATIKSFSFDVCNKLETYSWPGNVRELKSLIERLVLMTDGERINVKDLPERIIEETQNREQIYEISNLKGMVEQFEKDIIFQAVNKYGARKAAEKLEIDYSTLKRKKKSSLAKKAQAK